MSKTILKILICKSFSGLVHKQFLSRQSARSRSNQLKKNTIYPLLFFRMLVKRDPNVLPLMELNPNFQHISPTEEFDSRIITKLYMCPICQGKLVDPMHGGDHITRFHRIRSVDQMRLGLKLTEVPI